MSSAVTEARREVTGVRVPSPALQPLRSQQIDLLLDRASSMLTHSLDLPEALGRLGNLLVPQFADWCNIFLLDEQEDKWRLVLTGHADPALEPWRDWVLHAHPQAGCPVAISAGGETQCAWPGLLRISVSNEGAHFEQHWQLFREAVAWLPGDAQHWPQQVTVNGRAQAVTSQGDRPVVKLAAGLGMDRWGRRREALGRDARRVGTWRPRSHGAGLTIEAAWCRSLRPR